MSLKQKVKYIFSRLKYYQEKYGVIIGIIVVSFSIASIISTIISNIISSMKSGIKKLENGLKELGKKLEQILPGIIGTIVSFLFKTAGNVFGFLSKHIWLLILLISTFIVGQFKNKIK